MQYSCKVVEVAMLMYANSLVFIMWTFTSDVSDRTFQDCFPLTRNMCSGLDKFDCNRTSKFHVKTILSTSNHSHKNVVVLKYFQTFT